MIEFRWGFTALLSPALAVGLCLLAPAGAHGQRGEPPEAAAYALENVSVAHADGRRRSGVTLVVRGASVEALGAGVEVPADARLLEGDSLVVYPGIVDAFGEAEMELPAGPERSEVVPWSPGREAQGFTPHRRAADYLTATGSGVASQRRSGVVAAGVFPGNGLAAGIGAAVLFRRGAEVSRELVVRPEVGLHLSFQGASGAYPSTLFGVIAHIRQSYADAERHAVVRRAYDADPTGLTSPAWDPDYEVLRRTSAGDLPVFFRADDAGDIRRVLALSDELGFRPVVVGGGGAWRVAGELAERNVPVVVSVDFPEPDEWDPEAHTAGALEPGAAREKERLENLYANAGRLVEAGVTVALASDAGRADLRDGARKAIEHGLGEDAALRALTSAPASILGIPAAATIAPGRAATFLVADGPLFAEDTELRYTFVEGRLEEVAADDGPAPGDEPPSVDVTGEWRMELEAGGQATELGMTLEQDGARFTGTLTGPEIGGEARIADGVVSGAEIRFDIVVEGGGETLEIRATGTVEGDRIEGEARGGGPVDDFDFTATRAPGEAEGGLR